MKKNILLIMPNIEKGGIEKNLILLTSYLIKYFKITLVCGEISGDIRKEINKKVKIIIAKDYLRNKFLSHRIQNTINVFLEIFIKKKNIVKNETILFSLQNHPFPILLSKILKKKIIIRIANHPRASVKYFNNYIKFLLKIFIKIFFYKFADGIICNSNSSRYYLQKFLDKKSIITIYNPINSDKKFKVNYNRENLLTIGRLENQKNIAGIILALKNVKIKFPKIKLIVIGSGSKRKFLEDLVKRSNLKRNVEFKGYINPRKYLMKAKILILNSFFEGMPNVLLEGLLYKIPIISTNCESGPSEILKNGKYGSLVQVNNIKKLSKKIIYTLNNYNGAIKKSEEGYKTLGRFNKIKQLKKINDYIKNF